MKRMRDSRLRAEGHAGVTTSVVTCLMALLCACLSVASSGAREESQPWTSGAGVSSCHHRDLIGEGAPWWLLGPLPSSSHLSSPGADPTRAFCESPPRPFGTAVCNGETQTFPSELLDGGRAAWRRVDSGEGGTVAVEWPGVREDALTKDLGPGALSTSFGWAVTNFTVDAEEGPIRLARGPDGASPERPLVMVQCSGVVTFFVDGREMVGDPYANSVWWSPSNVWVRWPIALAPGPHTLRVVARAGGSFRCSVECDCSSSSSSSSQREEEEEEIGGAADRMEQVGGKENGSIKEDEGAAEEGGQWSQSRAAGGADFTGREERRQKLFLLMAESPSEFDSGLAVRAPDVVNGLLASPYASVPVVTADDAPPADLLIASTRARLRNADGISLQDLPGASASLTGAASGGLDSRSLRIAGGQAVPLPLEISLGSFGAPGCRTPGLWVQFNFTIEARFGGDEEEGEVEALEASLKLMCRGPPEEAKPFTFTFLDVDGSVQLAAAVPPPSPAPCAALGGCPVVFATHGAGVDAASPAWTTSIPPQEGAWLLFPSNRDKYGYDWQGLGEWDGLRALEYLAQALPGIPEAGKEAYGIDTLRILFTGHSMGGHGCLIYATKMADSALGAACAAGWIRFDQYATEWQGVSSSFADLELLSMLGSAVGVYHTDLAAPHLKGIPFLGRTGQIDESVNPWNLRRYVRVLDQINGSPGFAQLSEVKGQGHWFGDVMSGPAMAEFFSRALQGGVGAKPPVPQRWRVRGSGAGVGCRGGVAILQLLSPFRAAWVDVEAEGGHWSLKTVNVRRVVIQAVPGLASPRMESLELDGEPLPPLLEDDRHFCRLPAPRDEPVVAPRKAPRGGLAWQVCDEASWDAMERSAASPGPMREVLHGRIALVYGTQGPTEWTEALRAGALRIANKLFFRGHALVQVLSDKEVLNGGRGNNHGSGNKTDGLLEGTNVVLLGGPGRNRAAEALLPMTSAGRSSLRYHDRGNSVSEEPSFSFGGLEYSPRDNSGLLLHGAIRSAPPPKLLSAFSGTDGAPSSTSTTTTSSSGGSRVFWSALYNGPSKPLPLSVSRRRLMTSPSSGEGVKAEGKAYSGASGSSRSRRDIISSTAAVAVVPDGVPKPATMRKFALVDGTTPEAFDTAVGFFPVEPNAHVPDYLVIGPEAAWQGAGGILAAGYLGNTWEFRCDLSYPERGCSATDS